MVQVIWPQSVATGPLSHRVISQRVLIGEPEVLMNRSGLAIALLTIGIALLPTGPAAGQDPDLDAELLGVLQAAGFTGTIESTLETRLGRQLNRPLARLGRLLWFDKVHALHQ